MFCADVHSSVMRSGRRGQALRYLSENINLDLS